MEIFYVLLILLVITRAFGEVAVRLGQPALVGELLAGIALGAVIRFSPSSFPVMHGIPDNDVFTAITDLGIFFLMLMAGLEMRPREVVEKSKGAVFIAVGGLIIPLFAGFSLGWIFLPPSDVQLAQALFIGTALAITAVPVAAKVLMDLDKLRSTAGKMIVSAAIIDDILGLLLLAVLTAVIRTGEMPDPAGLLWLAGQILLFMAIVTAIGLYILPRLERVFHFSMSEEFEFSILLVVAFAFAVLAEALHMHFILGAFAAGLFFTKRTMDADIFKGLQSRISGITSGATVKMADRSRVRTAGRMRRMGRKTSSDPTSDFRPSIIRSKIISPVRSGPGTPIRRNIRSPGTRRNPLLRICVHARHMDTTIGSFRLGADSFP